MLREGAAQAACACLLLAAHLQSAAGQLSSPISSNDHVSVDGNRFLQRTADKPNPLVAAEEGLAEDDGVKACPQNVQLKWMAEATSSIYATPIITDLFADGFKDIIVGSFVHYLEAFQGDDGAPNTGFPAYHASKVHTSPIMFDVNQDGIQDILLATYDGEILFYKDTGQALSVGATGSRLIVPPLSVKRGWYENEAADNVDHDQVHLNAEVNTLKEMRTAASLAPDQRKHHFEASADLLGAVDKKTGELGANELPVKGRRLMAAEDAPAQEEPAVPAPAVPTPVMPAAAVPAAAVPAAAVLETQQQAVSAQGARVRVPVQPDSAGAGAAQAATATDPATAAGAQPAAGQDAAAADAAAAGASAGVEPDPVGQVSEEAAASFASLDAGSYDEDDFGEDQGPDGLGREGDGEGNEDGAVGLDVPLQTDDERQADEALLKAHAQHDWDWHDDYLLYHDDIMGGGAGDWDGEDFERVAAELEVDGTPEPLPTHVLVDAHIMCTPSLGDVDADGRDDLVIAVTYSFDRTYYDDPAHAGELARGIDSAMYLATGIVVFDMVLHTVKWSAQLDLSTDHVDYRAYAYSSPTLADLNQDGKLEIVVGTSVGYLYVLDSQGKPLPGWPIQMGEIQGQTAVADVDGDGFLEVFAADTRGSAAVFDRFGKLLWDVHVHSAVSQNAVFGDINGDGRLEVVFGTGSGQVHALDAATGRSMEGFPVNTTGRIVAPVLIVRLEDSPSQQLAVMSFDGFMYLIDGLTGCTDVVDIGESSYTSILADDLDNNGKLDLLVTTMNGHLYCFETPADYDPLKSWTSQVPGVSNFVARHGTVGIAATEMTARPKDIRGTTFPVEFEITDTLETAHEAAARAAKAAGGNVAMVEDKRLGAPYAVKILLQGIDTTAMNAGEQPIIGMSDTFQAPGKFTIEMPCPRSMSTAVVRLEMRDVNGIVYVHEFAQSFHMHFHKLLKWLIAGPLLAMSVFVLVLKPQSSTLLPA